MISNASKSDERKRKKLQDIYKKTSDFLDKLDPGLKISLQESFGDFQTTLKERITKLQPRREYTVLVAGKIMKNSHHSKFTNSKQYRLCLFV